jgi:catechol 2,3-dioxygenase-like lactoylglutathione lyase family enzyme
MDVVLEGLSLHVADLDRAMAFYDRIPGAERVGHRPGQFARYKIGTGSLHLVQVPAKQPFHLEFNTADVTGLHATLAAAGLDPARPQRHPWGKEDFRVVDPDGNILEFGCFTGVPAPSGQRAG